MTETVYIGLGANLGDRLATLRSAMQCLAGRGPVDVVSTSSVWESTPVGTVPQDDYLNAAAAIHTSLTPRQLLDLLLAVELQFGRRRLVRWGPRTLDLDILLWADRRVDEPGLTIPHPWLEQRLFVLEPLLEITPDLRHPVGGGALAERLTELRQLGQESVCRVAPLTTRQV